MAVLRTVLMALAVLSLLAAGAPSAAFAASDCPCESMGMAGDGPDPCADDGEAAPGGSAAGCAAMGCPCAPAALALLGPDQAQASGVLDRGPAPSSPPPAAHPPGPDLRPPILHG